MTLTREQREEVKRRLRRLRDKNGVRTLDPVNPSTAYEVAYYRELLEPVQAVADLVDDELLPLLERYEDRYVLENGQFLFIDSPTERIIQDALRGFDDYAGSFGKFAIQTAERFTRRNDDYHYRKFVRGVNKQFGVNIADQMTEYGVRPILQKTTRNNVDLIVDLPRQYYEKINNIVFDGLTSGDDFSSIRTQLEELKGISKRRAKLIAVDQTGKLIGKLNQQRQSNEGITRYQWDANLDARTRPRHVENDGEVFDWSDTSPGKAFGRPGEEVRCRCTGRGVIDEGVLGGRTPPPAGKQIPATRTKRTRKKAAPKPPPTQLSREQEFRQRLAKDEAKIAGNKRETGIVYDMDGNQVLRKRGGKKSVSFYAKDLKKWEGYTITHNHPGGSTFSDADVRIFTKYGLGEFRAVDPEYSHSLTGKIDKALYKDITRDIDSAHKEATNEVSDIIMDRWHKGERGPELERDEDELWKERYHEKVTPVFEKYGLTYRRTKNVKD